MTNDDMRDYRDRRRKRKGPWDRRPTAFRPPPGPGSAGALADAFEVMMDVPPFPEILADARRDRDPNPVITARHRPGHGIEWGAAPRADTLEMLASLPDRWGPDGARFLEMLARTDLPADAFFLLVLAEGPPPGVPADILLRGYHLGDESAP
jgi:hypothetical protein